MLFSKVLYLSRASTAITPSILIQTVWRVDSELAGAAVRVSRRRRRGHVPRRAAPGRSVRGEVRDLGLDPRRPAVHRCSCRISGLTGTVINSIAIGLILSSAFSAMIVYAQGIDPRQRGCGRGPLLRPVVRPRRRRRGAARHAGRHDEPQLRLSTSAPSCTRSRPPRRVPAIRPRQGERGKSRRRSARPTYLGQGAGGGAVEARTTNRRPAEQLGPASAPSNTILAAILPFSTVG